MHDWASFYSTTAGAAATLLGLLFVAVSISAGGDNPRSFSSTKALAEQAFQNYLAVLTISCLNLFPDIDMETVGITSMMVVSTASAWAVIRFIRTAGHADRDRFSSLRRYGVSAIGLAIVFFAAERIWSGSLHHFHLFAAGILTLLASSAVISWELLLRLLLRPSERKND